MKKQELLDERNKIARSIKVTLDNSEAPDNLADHVQLLMLQEYYPALKKIELLEKRIKELQELLKRANEFVGYLAEEIDAESEEIQLYKEICEVVK